MDDTSGKSSGSCADDVQNGDGITSWECGQEIITETKNWYEIVKILSILEGVLGIIPPFNFFFVWVRVLCAAISAILNLMYISPQIMLLATYYNEQSNWTDPTKYEAAMAMKKEAYT